MANISSYVIKYIEIILLVLLFLILLLLYFNYVLNTKNFDIEIKNSELEVKSELPFICKNLSLELEKSCVVKNSLCESDNCYYNKARLTLNESECFNIIDDNLKLVCSGSVNYNKIVQRAVLDNNLSLCDSLEELGSIACKNNYYYVLANTSGNKSYCSKISLEEIKNDCAES